MKQLFFLTISCILFVFTSNAQTACGQYNGDYNLIRNALIERAKAADLYEPTASSLEQKIKGWGDESIKFLAEKWVAICRCNEGVSKEVFDNEIYGRKSDNTLLINASPPYDRYFYNNQQGFKDLSIFGDLTPPNKIYISSDCVKGQSNNPDITHTDCWNHPDYKVDSKDDPQGYIKTFKMAECMCKGGVQTQQEAETLYRQMLDAYNSYKKFYPNSKIVLYKPSGPEICSKMVIDANGNPVITTQPQVNLVYTGYETETDKFKDQYIKTFSTPNEFNAYASGMNVKRVGEALAKDLSKNLNQIQGLINTSDPVALLQDFNQKITQIENLEASFNEQYNSYSFQTGQDLGKSISNKDYESAMMQGLGFLGSSLEKKEAEKQLEAKKQAAYEERRNQMSKIYWKAVDYNNSLRQKYVERVAYSENIADEQFNLAFIENLDCHNASMKNNFSVSHSGWLANNCPIPQRNFGVDHEKKDDKYYQKVAARKYELFKSQDDQNYLFAGIYFISKSIEINKKAAYYYDLGVMYRHQDILKAYHSFLTAKLYQEKYYDSEKEVLYNTTVKDVENATKKAIMETDFAFFEKMFQLGLEPYISIDQSNFVNFAISLNNLQLLDYFLQKFKAQDTKTANANIKNAILYAVANNNYGVVNFLMSKNYNFNFTHKKIKPIELAKKVGAAECYVSISSYLNDDKNLKLAQKMYEAQDESEFRLASATNTLHQWDLYINRFTEGKYIAEAKEKRYTLEELILYQEAMEKGDETLLRNFLAKYPNTQRMDVKEKFGNVIFEKAFFYFDHKDYYSSKKYFEEFIEKQVDNDPWKLDLAQKKLNFFYFKDYTSDFFSLDFDFSGSIGTSYNLISSHGLGLSYGFKFNPVGLFKYLDASKIDEISSDDFETGGYNDFGNLFNIHFDLNYKIINQVWAYGGIGFGVFEYGFEVAGTFNEELEYYSLRDEDQSGWYPYFRAGVIYTPYKKWIVRGGLTFGKLSTFEIGISRAIPW